MRCGILLTSDDTLGGRFSHGLLEEIAGRSRHVLGLKCGEEGGGIVTSCSGRSHYQIELSNVKARGKSAPDVITAACQRILAWQKLAVPGNEVYVDVNTLEARTLYGPTPDHASVALITRFRERDQDEKLDKRIREIAQKNARNLRVRVLRRVHQLPDSQTEATSRFFEQVEKQARRIDVRVQGVHRSVSSDVCYVPDEVPVLDGMGPVGGECRSPGEFIVRDSLIDRAALLALVIRDCAQEAGR